MIEGKILGFAVAMFVLSQISERVTNFFKLHFLKDSQQASMVDFSVKNSVYDRNVFYWSILGGMITTALFATTFFWSAEADSDNALSWMRKYFNGENPWQSISAFISVSIFLSFGSKFWHDILDIIFFYKNMRRKLSDPLLYQQESTQQIELFLEGTSQELAEVALENKLPKFQKSEGFVGISTTYSELKGEHILRVRFESAEDFVDLNRMLYYRDRAGMKRRIEVEYLATGKVKAHSIVDYGLEVGTEDFKVSGRCCYFFKSTNPENKQIYGLTCAHVFGYTGKGARPGPFEIELTQSTSNQLLLETEVRYVDGYDAAFFPVPDLQKINLDGISPVDGTLEVKKALDESIVLISGQGGKVKARIEDEYLSSLQISYVDGSKRTFRGLIAIKSEDFGVRIGESRTAPTVPGDSGSLVQLKNQQGIGMIVAGDNYFSYAIKLTEIEKLGEAKLCTISELRELQAGLNS